MNSSRTINADVSAVITNLATGVTAKPDATFKPSYDTPNATYAVLRQASKTRDLDLLLTCLTPRAAAGLTGGLDGELLREIAPAVIAALGEPALGKLISDNGDTRVYEYSRNGRPVTNDTQRMVKLDGKWLLDNWVVVGIINDTTKELRVTQKSRDASLRATRRFLGGEPALKVSSPSGGAMSPLQLAVSVRRATAQDSER